MARSRNVEWNCPRADDNSLTHEHVTHQILMDIRDELEKLNAVLQCTNFRQIPMVLRAIRANTSKPKKLKSKRAA